jgi:hypothetical protein
VHHPLYMLAGMIDRMVESLVLVCCIYPPSLISLSQYFNK